jgi:hypothetical protein
MITNRYKPALLTLALLLASVASSTATAQVVYSGRAVGARVILVNPQPNELVFSDTGELPPEGGKLSATLATILVGGTLSSQTVHANAGGGGGSANSMASQEQVIAFPGQPAQLTATVVASQAHADCNGVSGSSVVTDLTFGGVAVKVMGAPNQTVGLSPVAVLVINEQIVGPGQSITVNALHLTLGTGEQVILSGSHSDVDCATGARLSTWGRVKALYR